MNREIIEKYPDSKIKKVRFIEDESNPRVTTEITYKENGKTKYKPILGKATELT